MSIQAAMGLARGLDGREAAVAAVQQASSQMGGVRPAAGLVFVSQEFNPADSLAALRNSLPNTAFWGASTVCPLKPGGEASRSVLVLLLGGGDLQARAYWYGGYAQNSAQAAKNLAQDMVSDLGAVQALLLAADGMNGDPALLMDVLQPLNLATAGCLAGGDVTQARSVQISGAQAASGGLAGLVLSGRMRLGCGSASAWKKTGLYYRITQSRGLWIQGLDEKLPAEIYSQAFHYPAREWGFPPLKTLVRQYPLGVNLPESGDLLAHAPLHMEVDGSMRVNIPLAGGQVAHLLAGDPQAAPDAACQAARRAIENLQGAKPLAALAFVDEAYRVLLQSQPADLYAALRDELPGLPLGVVYTLGQIAYPQNAPAAFANCGISVAVMGVTE